MDNPGGQIIEKLEFTNGGEEHQIQTIKPTGDKSDPASASTILPNIVRPSSLNYKISLLEAVIAFVQKDKQSD